MLKFFVSLLPYDPLKSKFYDLNCKMISVQRHVLYKMPVYVGDCKICCLLIAISF